MAWTAPRTWTTGEVVTAAIMNSAVRDNELYLRGLTDPRWRAPNDFTAIAGTPAIGTIITNYRAWAFDGAATETITTELYFPVAPGTVTVKLFWTVTSGSGNVLWVYFYAGTADGEALNGAGVTDTETVAIPTANNLKVTTFSTTFSPVAGEEGYFHISRTGGDAADTHAADAHVLGVLLDY